MNKFRKQFAIEIISEFLEDLGEKENPKTHQR
jgi:hypothetical protein